MPSTPSSAREELRLGELLLRERLLTESQLEEALADQAGRSAYLPLGQILIERKLVTRKQIRGALDRQRRRLRLGQVLVRAGVLTEAQLQRALDYARRTGFRLGEAIVQLDLASDAAIRQALCAQLNVPFVDLESFTPDPSDGLHRLVKMTYAQRHRLVPIARLGTSITVAMDDPTDDRAVQELERVTGCTVNVVTTTTAGFKRAYGRVYAVDAADRIRIDPKDTDRPSWR
jgi:hypothetical protein